MIASAGVMAVPDAHFLLTGSGKAAYGRAASPSQMGRFETQWLATDKNLSVRENLAGRTEALEDLAVELFARGLSTRDIEAAFTDAEGRRLVSRAAVSEITERLWEEYEAFTRRDLSEFAIVYLFVDGLAER